MKEEILGKFFEKMLMYVNKGEVFLGAEIPKYIEEILTYNFYVGILGLILSVVIFSVFLIVAIKLYNAKRKDFDTFGTILYSCLVIFLLGIPFSFGVRDLDNAIKIKVAPRVFIIDYLKNSK